jgi:RNA polymerase sigma-70 factor (ECF subfamily)
MSQTEKDEEFRGVLERHKRILYKVANAYCRNPTDREDLTQEIVIQLWRSFPSFDSRVAFSTWMYRVALNVAISFYRRDSARSRRELPVTEVMLQAPDPAAAHSPEIDDLHAYIATLDEWTKALVLLYLDGHTHAEIAHILGITETNVSTKISRIKQTMRRQLAKA